MRADRQCVRHVGEAAIYRLAGRPADARVGRAGYRGEADLPVRHEADSETGLVPVLVAMRPLLLAM